MDIESLILDLAFILLLGAIVSVLFKWIKQPVVLGYIVAGFLASPQFTYLPSVASEGNIKFWAEIGIVILLFSLGLEFSFKKLVNSGASAVATALIIVSGMMGIGYIVGYAMGFSSINCLFLGGMLSMSSTTIILKAFNDLGLRHQKFASQVLAVLIVEDLFAVVMMVILSSIAAGSSVQGSELFYSIAKLVFFLVIWFLVGVYVLPSLLRKVDRFLNSETLLVVSMGLCLGMAFFSVICGFSLALGAFVMGSILAGTSFAERIEHVVTPVKDLFGAVFFISVGMMVNPTVIAQYWPSILLLSIVVICGMIVFGTFGMLVTGQTLRVAIQSGFSLTQIGEFAFIIATLGMSLGVLDSSLYPIIVAVSVLTTFTTPMFIKMSVPAYNFIERHLPARLRFLIDRYHKNVNEEQAESDVSWFNTLKPALFRTLLYSIVLIAIVIISRQFLRNWLTDIIPQWSRVLTLIVTLGIMTPFLMAMVSPLARVIASVKQNTRSVTQTRVSAGQIVIAILSFIIALWFVASTIIWLYSMRAALSVLLAAVLLIIMVFSTRVRQRMTTIENRFLKNLNERELRRRGTNNTVVADLHLAYMTLGNGSEFVGKRLLDTGLRGKYHVNVVSVQRAEGTVTPMPPVEMILYPGDTLGVVGNDEQLANLLPQVEATLPVQTGSSGDEFSLFPLRLDPGSPLIGRTPRSSRLRNNYNALVLAVERGDDFIDNDSSLIFAAGDILWLYADRRRLLPMLARNEEKA